MSPSINPGFKGSRLVCTLVPLVVYALSLLVVFLDHSSTVVHVAGGDGQPELYEVYASSALKAAHTISILKIIAGALVGIVAVYGYLTIVDNAIDASVFWPIVVFLWLFGAALIFGWYWFDTPNTKYFISLSADAYKAAAGNFDQFFPR